MVFYILCMSKTPQSDRLLTFILSPFLHLLGIDHRKLTYRYQGRDFRLTDVHDHVIKDLLL
jgi:hypothetical protein